jgi:tetratricopeptide (TPR) repeat protein
MQKWSKTLPCPVVSKTTFIMRQICFMVMPFGKKSTGLKPGDGPTEVDFDTLWENALAPLLEELGYAPIRADADAGSLIIGAMLERLVYADLILADISIPNANVYYEIGVRHAARQRGCVLIAANWSRPLFDITQMRRLSYPLPNMTVTAEIAQEIRDCLKPAIQEMAIKSSPVHETVPAVVNSLDQTLPSVADVRKDLANAERIEKFRSDMEALSTLLANIRGTRAMPNFDKARQKDKAIEIRDSVESGGAVQDALRLEVMRLLRDCVGWQETLDYIETMPPILKQRPEVQEQKLLALAKRAKPEDAEDAIARLEELIQTFGATSERYGLIGGRYKVLYRAAHKAGETQKEKYYLDKAIEAYTQGMQKDFNDYYPTCNLPQLCKARGNPEDLEMAEFAARLTVQACERATALKLDDEWTKPTLLGAAFDTEDYDEANRWVQEVEKSSPAAWKLDSTLDDLEQRITFIKDADKQNAFQLLITRLENLL